MALRTWLRAWCALALAVFVIGQPNKSEAQTFLDKIKIGRHKQTNQHPLHPCFGKNFPPANMIQLANCIDVLEEGIRDDGVIAIQRPSVWGQARMTLYRKDFENGMKAELSNFALVLSARVARTDQAAFESQTALGAALQKPGKGSSSTSSTSTTTSPPDALSNLTNMLKASDANGLINRTNSLGLLTAAYGNALTIGQGAGNLGVEPTVYLDEKKRYLDHLNEIRRVNMGDDNADSAGYGMYLVRLPVSIDPGEKTREGHGAILNVSAHHDFGPYFLQKTYRNLVINDLIDQLTPLVHETIRHNLDAGLASFASDTAPAPATKESQQNHYSKMRAALTPGSDEKTAKTLARALTAMSPAGKRKSATVVGGQVYPIAPSDILSVFNAVNVKAIVDLVRSAQGTVDPRATDIRSLLQHELEAAYDLMERGVDPEHKSATAKAPFTDFALMDKIANHFYSRQFKKGDKGTLQGSLEEDYSDLMSDLADQVKDTSTGAFCWIIAVDATLLNRRLRDEIKRLDGCHGFHCPQDVFEANFYLPPSMACDDFGVQTEHIFEEYVKARWPIVTFSIDPVVDQQNIADAFSRHRELQIAMAFSFATGQINFNQLMRFQRRMEMDAETIALNKTVTGFAHGDDAFGWKFTPRFQNPPSEKNNAVVLANTIWRGGPGRDFGTRRSRLEVGQRELTAVIVMPAFLNQIRLDVLGNWFRLTNSDDLRITTARQLELGRWVKELRELPSVCDQENYRSNDYRRLLSKLDQIEKMLPLQTHITPVPYENQLGGFSLFGQGHTALVPLLVGYEGIDAVPLASSTSSSAGAAAAQSPTGTASVSATVTATVNPTATSSSPAAAKTPTDYHVMLYGKHFSINETTVVVGGQVLQQFNASGAIIGDVDILSREVMHVRIPAAVIATAVKDPSGPKQYVEVVVATPNGVSNRLLIPVQAPATQPSEFSIAPTNMAVTWRLVNNNPAYFAVSPTNLTIARTLVTGFAPTTLALNVTVTANNKDVIIAGGNATVSRDGTSYTVSPADLGARIISGIANDAVAATILQPIAGSAVPLTIKSITVTPVVQGLPAPPAGAQPAFGNVTVNSQLSVTLQYQN